MKKLNNDNKKVYSSTRHNNINKLEKIYQDEDIIQNDSKKSKDTVSLKNNSGRFVFTLNGENEKESNSKQQIESEEKSERTLTTKREMTQEEFKINENENENIKKKEEKEKEIGSFSSNKKINEYNGIIARKQ